MPRQTAMQRVHQRGLAVSPEEAAAFPFDHSDILIAEALLQGCHTAKMIAVETGLAHDMVRARLLDAQRSAWLSQEIAKAVETRLGNAFAAVYARVMRTGDPQAMKLLLAQFGKLVQRPKEVRHTHAHIDFSALSTDELKKYIAEQKRRLGEDRVVDAEYTVTEESPDAQ